MAGKHSTHRIGLPRKKPGDWQSYVWERLRPEDPHPYLWHCGRRSDQTGWPEGCTHAVVVDLYSQAFDASAGTDFDVETWEAWQCWVCYAPTRASWRGAWQAARSLLRVLKLH